MNGCVAIARSRSTKEPICPDTWIAKLPGEVDHTGYVKSEGLTCTDRWHFDTKSQIELGQRYAEQMLKLQAEADKQDEAE